MKRIPTWLLPVVMVFMVATDTAVLSAQVPRPDIRRLSLRVIPRLQLARADFMVRNVRIEPAADCSTDFILKVTAQVWNIGDADYNADVKATNLYWDYGAGEGNKSLWYGGVTLPSIPRGNYVEVTNILRRSTLWPHTGRLLSRSEFINVLICPNEQEDYVLEKDFTNNVFRKKVQNPCYRRPLSRPIRP